MAQTIKIKRSATSGNKLTGSNSIAGEIGMNTTDKSLYIQTGSTDASVVTVYDDSILHLDDTNNRVGIGTTSPTKSLHLSYNSSSTSNTGDGLAGGAAGGGLLIQNTNSTSNTYANLDFRAGTADGRIVYQYTGTTNRGDFHFITDNNNVPESQLTIKNDGKVGVGNAAPSHTLDVTGTGRFTGAVTLDSTLSFSYNGAITALDLNNNNIIKVNNIAFADAGPNEGLSWSGGNTRIFESPDDLTTNTAGNLQLVYNNTRRLTVNNTGIDVNGTITGATNISKQVARTATGGTDTENGPNTWAKLATYSVSGNYQDGTFIYGVVTEEQSLPAAGTIIVRVRWGDLAGSVNPTVKVEWTSKNSGNTLGTDAFKLIGDGVSDDIELWVQKDVNYGCIELWELAYRKESNNSVSVSYEDNSAWQSSTPTGTAVNETSGTLTFDGKEVLLGDDFDNDTNLKLIGKFTQATAVNTNDAAYIRNSGTGTALAVNQQGTGDILRVDDNSTTKLIVKDGGRVGLGLSAPNTNLHVKVEGDGNGITIQRNSTTGGTQAQLSFHPSTNDSGTPNLWIKGVRGASSYSDNFMTFGTNSLERMRIDAAGNIAIGQTATPQKLTVAGNITVTGTTGIQIATISRVNNAGRFHLNDSGGTTRLELNSVGDSYFNASGGKVGIGTTTPSGTLHVKSTGNGEINIERASGALINIQAQASAAYIGTNTNHQFGLKSNGTVRLKIATNGAISFNDAFTFPTSDGQANQVLKTDGSGNVSWATEAATSASTSMSDADGDTKIQVEESADEDKIRFDAAGVERFRIGSDIEVIAATDFNITGANRRINFTSGTGTIRTTGASSLHLATNNTNRISIDSNGRVGIGHSAANAQLHVNSGNNTSVSIGDATNPAIQVGGTTNYRFGVYTDGEAGYIENKNGDDGLVFRVKTAGEAMRIDGGTGRVGIGTTSPSQKLDVNGAAKIRGTGDGTVVAHLGQMSNSANNPLFSIYTDDDGTTRPLGGDALEFNTARWGSVFGQTRSSAAGGSVRAWKFQTDTNSNERGTSLYIYTQADASATGSTTTTNDVLISAVSNVNSYINTSANFGLGTNNPSRKFEVHENNTYLTIGEKSGYTPSTYGPILETNADALVLPQYAYLKGSQAYIRNESNLMRIHGDSGIKFSYYNGSATTEGMRLDNSGRLLINTTSSIDNTAKLQIVGNSSSYARITMQDADGTNQKTFFDHSNGLTSIITQNGTSNGAFGIRGWNGSTTTDFVRVASNGNVGIGTTSPSKELHVKGGVFIDYPNGSGSSLKIGRADTSNYWEVGHAGADFRLYNTASSGSHILFGVNNGGGAQNNNVGIGTANPNAKLQVEELGIDTTTTTTSATTQVAIDTMAAATFRSARYTIQITNTTDSSYHITEVLLIHDGTTPAITEYGTVFTGSAAEATIDADISSGNVRLLATPASTDSMTFKVVRHCITV